MFSTATLLKYDGKTSELTLLIVQQYYVRDHAWQVLSKPKWFARKLSLKREHAFLLQKILISSDMVSCSNSSELRAASELSYGSRIFHISFL